MPGRRHGVARRVIHQEIADQCRRRPGEWVPVNVYPALYVARSMCSTIRGGRSNTKIIAYSPSGAFDARYEEHDDGWEVYACYLGEEAEQCASTRWPPDTGDSASTGTPEAGPSRS